jgi:hypothetical protein
MFYRLHKDTTLFDYQPELTRALISANDVLKIKQLIISTDPGQPTPFVLSLVRAPPDYFFAFFSLLFCNIRFFGEFDELGEILQIQLSVFVKFTDHVEDI